MTEADLCCPHPQLSHQLWLVEDGADPEAGTRNRDHSLGGAKQGDNTNGSFIDPMMSSLELEALIWEYGHRWG